MSLLSYLRMAVLIYSEEILLTNNVLYKHEKKMCWPPLQHAVN